MLVQPLAAIKIGRIDGMRRRSGRHDKMASTRTEKRGFAEEGTANGSRRGEPNEDDRSRALRTSGRGNATAARLAKASGYKSQLADIIQR